VGAQDWIQAFVIIFVVTIVYGFIFYPMFSYVKALMLWFGQGTGCQEIIDLANFIALVLTAIPYIIIIWVFVWLFVRATQKEAHEKFWWE